MPFVDILSSGDYVSLWYITNSPYNNVGSFDSTKPTIILLHPLYLDSTWLITQFEDPRLDLNYNMIAFDIRACGQSMSRPSAVHDSWVEAADLARAHQVSDKSSFCLSHMCSKRGRYYTCQNATYLLWRACQSIARFVSRSCEKCVLPQAPPP